MHSSTRCVHWIWYGTAQAYPLTTYSSSTCIRGAGDVSTCVESCRRLLRDYSNLIYFDRRTAYIVHRALYVRSTYSCFVYTVRFPMEWCDSNEGEIIICNKWSSVECDGIKDLLPSSCCVCHVRACISSLDERIVANSRIPKKKKIIICCLRTNDNTHPHNLWLGPPIYRAQVFFFFISGWMAAMPSNQTIKRKCEPVQHTRCVLHDGRAAAEKPLQKHAFIIERCFIKHLIQ